MSCTILPSDFVVISGNLSIWMVRGSLLELLYFICLMHVVFFAVLVLVVGQSTFK